ncbi:MAG: hypothetical protein ACXWUL_00250 [Caldimonas sp.]
MMSVAGLGLSLAEVAHAKSDASARGRRAHGLGLPGLPGDGGAGPVHDADPALLAGPLDATLAFSNHDPVEPSIGAQAAEALAMVLMAESPSPDGPTVATVGEAAPQHDAYPEFWHEFPDASAPGESLASPARAGDRQPETASAARTSAAAPRAVVEVDIDLGAPAAKVQGVDLNVALAPELDLNLDLSPALDLNLDFAADVDLRLDRPPVFAETRLKPVGSATKAVAAARAADTALMACTAAEPPLLLREVPAAELAAALSASPKSSPQAAQPLPEIAIEHAPQSGPEVATMPAPKAAPKIIVASHPERALRSLEALLASEDPLAATFGAATKEVIVSSHAERALLTLAEMCAGDAAQPPLRVSKVEPAPPARSCKPAEAQVRAAASPRRSPVGVVALAAGALDKVRGGFETPNGFRISFGIERAVYVNGALVTTTSLNVSDLGKVSGGQGTVGTAVAGSGNLTLIQNGAGNTFVTGPVSPAMLGTVVQNTLNDQKIQTVTSINASVNSLEVVRAQNLQSSLRGALIDSLRR